MKTLDFILAHDTEILGYLKSRFPVFHLSNIFFRDIHYGILSYLTERRVKSSYGETEKIAQALIQKLEREKILRPVDRQTWMVQYPEFRTPQTKPAPPAAKPVAAQQLSPA